MNKGKLVIITGMSGVKPKKVISIFNKYLDKHSEPPIHIVDIEKILDDVAKKDPDCSNSSDFQNNYTPDVPIVAITMLPFPTLRRLWLKTIEIAKQKIEKKVKAGKNVALVLHAVYFKPDSTELIPIADSESLKKVTPDSIVHLIDDIYDIYAWLREPHGIFDATTSPDDSFQQIQTSLRQLYTILNWRQFEGGVSAHVASVLDIPFWTVATKHRCKLLKKIFDCDVIPAYLSHPISEPRRALSEGNEVLFKQCTDEVNTLAEHLTKNLAIWEPTTIDELRILQINLLDQPKPIYLPRLTGRWPITKIDDILWTCPTNALEDPLDPSGYFTQQEIEEFQKAKQWEDIKNIAGEEKSQNLRFISGQLEYLASLIGQQINSRDRTLVAQCPTIVAYRPFFNGNVAGGVRTELWVHDSLAQIKHYTKEPSVCVLVNSEDEYLVWVNAVSNLLCSPKGRWSAFIVEQDGNYLSVKRATEVAKYVTEKTLDAKKIVTMMEDAAHKLKFKWGSDKQGTLNGEGPGHAKRDFNQQRVQELRSEVEKWMRCNQELKALTNRQVYRFENISVPDFAEKILDSVLEDRLI